MSQEQKLTNSVTSVETRPSHMCRLACPLCERPNGFWHVNFKALFDAKGSVSKRKKCRRCKVSLLYRAAYNDESKKVAVLCHMDAKAQKQVAKLFNVDLEDVVEAIQSVKEEKDEKDAFLPDV